MIEMGRCRASDLNDGPLPDQRYCGRRVRQGTAHNEMIVAMHQNADHTRPTFQRTAAPTLGLVPRLPSGRLFSLASLICSGVRTSGSDNLIFIFSREI